MFFINVDSISGVSDEGGIALSLIQLIALFIPALAIFTQAILQYSESRANEPGKSGGVGKLGAEELRFFTFMSGAVSSLLLGIGLVMLIAALKLPSSIEVAAVFIMIAILFVPFTLSTVCWNMYVDR
ncbi:hypothetical protein [Halosimplex amylolyticum]|uniref:hypothetical protein n=1 Tax=Halosimplex amylolyticum TaxID=3396616 RepID=UPI003F551BBB